MAERIAIIGAGQAGAQAAVSLRRAGFDGAITMIGDERAPPYQRPPLSKAYLQGQLEEARLFLRPVDFYAAQRIDLRLDERVARIDLSTKSLALESSDAVAFDKLLIATGAPPRRFPGPGADLPGVHCLRTLFDSAALRPVLSADGRIVIVGAGYIGLEVAAVARKAGLDVTVLEMADRVLARVAGKEISAFYEKLHRDAGVDLRLGESLKGFDGEGVLKAAELGSGELIACAAALVCIGAVPQTRLAEDAGLAVANGIVVNEYTQTSHAYIWAAGDCTNFPSTFFGRRLRLESVPNAIGQAKAAALNMAGKPTVYDPQPWFWSDQYDVKLQSAGLGEGADETVVRGDASTKRFSVWSLREGAVIAVDAVNDPASFMIGKQLIAARAHPAIGALADSAVDLKTLL